MSLVCNLHCHSDVGSLYDGAATPRENAARADELGAKAVAMTDHGTLTATWDYIAAVNELNEARKTEGKEPLKFIPGVELYVEDRDDAENRRHLVLLAKSFKGWQSICKVVTESNYNTVGGYPIATEDSLVRWFGEGTPGHGEVFATSACMQGVLASFLLKNWRIKKKEDKIRRKQGEKPDYELFYSLEGSIESDEAYLQSLRAERDAIKVPAYANRLKKALDSGNADKIAEARALEAEANEASAKLENIKKEISDVQAKMKKAKEEREPIKKLVEKYEKYEVQIKELNKNSLSDRQAKSLSTKEAEKYREIFGINNFFIEVQYHGIEEEKYVFPILVDIAKKLNIPLVAANDSHIVRAEDAEVRQVIHGQHYSYNEIRDEDREMYIKTNEEMAEWLKKILPEKAVQEAINNIEKIVDACNVEFTAGTHYPKYPCKEGATIHLRKLVAAGKKKIPVWTNEYQKRLEHELRIIESMGFSDYFCIIEDFLNYARIIGKLDLESEEFLNNKFNIEKLKEMAKGQVGEGCGPGRGSAAGSLVAYLVGITNIDPIKNELLFERFLNPERVTMPDVDSDIAPLVRPFVIEYIKNKYGEKAVCQILTRGFFGAKSSINAAARVLGKKMGDDKKFLGLGLDMSKSIEDLNTTLDDVEDKLKADFPSEAAEEIIRIAHLLEGKCQNYGTHAAGIIISDNGDVSDHLPLIRVTDAIDCQCDLNYVEPLGMLKLDLLGLRNLGIITECEKAIQANTGENISIDNLPPDDPEVMKNIFAAGKTNGVFQFESDGMKKVLIGFEPESISDLTLLNALFRPGPLQYIDDVTAVKKGLKTPEYVIPEMAEILGQTYGKPVYQEQIMEVFHRFAGFSLGEADVIRRYMSKKKFDKFAAYKDKFIDGLVAHGADRTAAEKFWDELLDFSAYAFNKSHARAYSEVAYATAYLKFYYPAAYTVGLLNYTASDKREEVLLEAKNNGIEIQVPDINIAGENFVLNGDKVVYGLSSVTQVSASASLIINERNKNGKFASFEDFIRRCPLRKNVIENLIKAGSFDRFCKNRNALLIAYDEKSKAIDTLNKKEERLVVETSEKRKATLETVIAEQKRIIAEPFKNVGEERVQRLINERDVLGYFVSEHPVIRKTGKPQVKDILENGGDTVVFISSVEFKTSKNGKKYAVVNCEDETGSIKAMAFEKTLTFSKDLLKENNIVNISLSQKDGFIINKVSTFTQTEDPYFLRVSSYEAFKKEEKRFLAYKGNKQLIIFCKDTGKWKVTKMFVNNELKTSKRLNNI